MAAIRLRKVSYRTRLIILLVAITLVLVTNRTVFTYSHNKSQNGIKAAEVTDKLASVNRISATFARFQQRITQEISMIAEQNRNNKTVVNKDGKSLVESNDKQLMLKLLAEQGIRHQESNEDFITYLTMTDIDDLQDPYVNLHFFEYILNNENACNGDVLAVITINSDPSKRDERMIIRESWGSVKSYSGAKLVTLFLLAQVKDENLQEQINKENQIYSDIIQGNFIDSYRNLTHKSVMGLHWVQKYCNHTKFVLKVDDDTLIDPYHLVDFLFQKSPDGNLENFLYCSTFRNQGPVRRTDDKWFVPNHEYPYSKYPPYCEGFAYIMSYDVAQKLYETTSIVKFYWIDDVYITGLVALKAGVSHHDMENGHSYNLLQSEHLSKNVQSSMFLLAKYKFHRQNWSKAWNDIQSLHAI